MSISLFHPYYTKHRLSAAIFWGKKTWQMFTIFPLMECWESILPVDTCQGAGSQPYPLGWIRILFISTQTWIRLCSSVFSAACHGELLYSASLKWRRCDYTRPFIDQPFTLLDGLPQNVHALRFSIRCLQCPSKSPHPSLLWLHCHFFEPTYSQDFAVRQGNWTILLAEPIQ